jgi:TolB-like protein
MLAGTAPFTGSTMQAVITKRFTEPVPSVRAARKEVTGELEQVVTKALAKDPGDRLATAAQMVQALGSPKVMTPPNATPLATPVAPAPKSIAVLPFADRPAARPGYFCEGMAEELINALMRSRSCTWRPGPPRSGSRAGSRCGDRPAAQRWQRPRRQRAQAGTKLRITAQLINVADGYHIWSERFDRDMEDVFAIQDEIAESIAKALRVVLSAKAKRAIEKPPTAQVEAYDYYLRGRQFFHQWRRKGVEYARRMFERAIEVDPNYALAHAGIADCCAFIYTYWDASAAHLEQADTASRKALELAPDLAEVHTSRGLALAFAKRFEEAEREFQTAPLGSARSC